MTNGPRIRGKMGSRCEAHFLQRTMTTDWQAYGDAKQRGPDELTVGQAAGTANSAFLAACAMM
jgi:hypothetical protein